MVRIKICGITNLDDAILAVDYGADALGFMFYRESKRYISPEEAGKIISKLPPFVVTVGVFVNQELDEIRNAQKQANFDIVQLHGDESPDFCKSFGGRAIKAIRVRDGQALKEVESYSVQAVLFDKHSNESYGGTGMSFDWEILRNFHTSKKVILSGGLSPENVAPAIRVVNPYAVDVSSGVEEYPGKKNPKKLKMFIEAVRNGNEIKTA
ncbi:MAG TPA: phosphoribosylanthranilate isomerase [Thermodesulfobacteriota bacterium]|nr:phosphoribosylanthranilate isomerase [Thermodesulfobacteriota bacterium]